MESIIFSLTGKHSDFVGRTYIWDSVISMIKEKPIIGYGKEYTEAGEYTITLQDKNGCDYQATLVLKVKST